MKTLHPTLHQNQRYIRIKIESDRSKNFEETVKLVKNSVKDFSGDKGLAEIRPWVFKEKFSSEKQEAVVRINSDFEEEFRASMALARCKVLTKNVSGTLDSV